MVFYIQIVTFGFQFVSLFIPISAFARLEIEFSDCNLELISSSGNKVFHWCEFPLLPCALLLLFLLLCLFDHFDILF